MAENIWQEREQVILEAIYAAEEAGATNILAAVGPSLVAGGMELETYKRTVLRLIDGGYIDAKIGNRTSFMVHVNGLTKLGLQQVAAWPSPEAGWERLVAALEARADEEPEEGKKRILRQAARSMGAAGQTIGTGLLSEVIRRAVLGA